MKSFLLVLVLLVPGIAFADDSRKNQTVDLYPTASLQPIIVTPSRAPLQSDMVPSDVTVISASQIESSGDSTIGEVLSNIGGLYVYNDGEVKTDKVDIRGFADTAVSNVLIMIDGRKINSIDISGPDLSSIPVESIERIEIIRGASSVLYGDNAVGGVVNIITKEGCGKANGSIEYEAGSYGLSTENVNVNGSMAGLSYDMDQKYSGETGYRANSTMIAKDYDGKFAYSLTDTLTINSSIIWHQDQYGLPGGLSAQDIALNGRRSSDYPNSTDYASTLDKTFTLGIDDKSDLGDISLDGSYQDKTTYAFFNEDPYGATAVKYDITTTGILAKDILKGKILDHEFETVAGVDLYDSENRILGGGYGLSQDFDRVSVYKYELGAYDNTTLWLTDRLNVNAGYRYQYAHYTFNDAGNDLKTTQNANAPVGNAGLTYEYAPGSNVHASVAQTFRFLATDEWYSTFTGLSTSLKQQTGIQYEVGVKQNIDDITTVTATPYLIDNKNEIFYDPYEVFFGENSNYGHTRRIGIELTQTTDLLKILKSRLDALNINSTFTYQDPKFVGGPYNNHTIPMVPYLQSTTGIEIGFLKHFTFTANEKYTGQQYAIDDVLGQTARVKQYCTTDLKLSYKIGSIEIAVGVDNLFNEYYNDYVVMSTIDTDKAYYPAPGRTIYSQLTWRF